MNHRSVIPRPRPLVIHYRSPARDELESLLLAPAKHFDGRGYRPIYRSIFALGSLGPSRFSASRRARYAVIEPRVSAPQPRFSTRINVIARVRARGEETVKKKKKERKVAAPDSLGVKARPRCINDERSDTPRPRSGDSDCVSLNRRGIHSEWTSLSYSRSRRSLGSSGVSDFERRRVARVFLSFSFFSFFIQKLARQRVR